MVEVRFLGHSFFKISFSEATFLIDPFVYDVKETKRLVKCPITTKKLKNIDAILVTHEHFDHFDKKAIEEICENESCCVIAHDSVLNELNISKNLKRPISKEGVVNLKGVKIKAISAHHPHSFYPMGFHLESKGVSVFHAGDTDLVPGLLNVKSNIALLPIGGHFTMDLIDAVKLVKTTKPDVVIPMSYNTFDFMQVSQNDFSEKINKSILKTKPIILKPGEKYSHK